MNSIYMAIVALLGLSIGSFINAWVWRSSVNKKIWKGRSICPQCKHPLACRDLIPLISYLSTKGSCRYCKKPIGIQYPLGELCTMLAFVHVYYVHGGGELLSLIVVRDWGIISILMYIAIYDIRFGYILDRVTFPASIAIGIFSWFTGIYTEMSLIIGVFIGSGFFLCQFFISKGKWIGGGDIRLGMLMGVILGYPNIIIALCISYIFGAIISVYMLITKKMNRKSRMPFAPYLTFGTYVALLYGREIAVWYLSYV